MGKLLEKRKLYTKDLTEQKSLNLQLFKRVEKLENLAGLGLNWSMIAHQMNNLLTPLKCYAELAQANPDDIDLSRKVIKKTAVNAEKAVKMLNTIMDMARGSTGKKEICCLRNLIEDAFLCIGRDLKKDRIIVQLKVPADMQIYAEKVCIEQVMMNLILNARDAMLGIGGRLEIGAVKKDRLIEITVSDTGKGISQENITKIFEPFVTTKKVSDETDGGFGLGLALCRKIVQSHRGNITVSSECNLGSTFTVSLPGC